MVKDAAIARHDSADNRYDSYLWLHVLGGFCAGLSYRYEMEGPQLSECADQGLYLGIGEVRGYISKVHFKGRVFDSSGHHSWDD